MHLIIHRLSKSNDTHTYYSVRRGYPGPKKKIGTVTIDRVGNRTVTPYPGRTVTPYPGRTVTETEIRMMRGFEP